MPKYDHKKIESKWIKNWEGQKLYEVDLDKAKKPFYNLMMFPYPSAEGLHVGNMYAFVHSDTYGRFMRLKGYDVFEPIGLDGFGIHSENYAIKIKEHIKDVSARTEKHFYEQLHMIGNAYDWSRTVETYKPNYYKWTQWLFLKMYEKGLAYRKESPVNWCPSCKTVLSDEQVIVGKCERCDTKTEKKMMAQWFWKITDYAEKLLNNLKTIDWSEDVKTIQENWIGRSEGAEVKFQISNLKLQINSKSQIPNSKLEINVYTTRPDTLFGCTYMVLAPEHPLVLKLGSCISNFNEVEKYIEKTIKKSDIERQAVEKEKTGVELKGIKAINPVNNEEIPVFIADYVMTGYGTGAIMAVPAHDERDYEFAKKFKLPIIEVIKGGNIKKQAFTEDGINVNSGFLDGLKTDEATKKMVKWLEKNKIGKKAVNYKLRDWCVSRQRYWGPPIPMVECEKCGWAPVPEKDLPVLLPEMEDFLPDGTGKGPLNKVKDFVNTTCPKCGGPAKRETDVSDPFVDSSWYFMRYLCTDFENKALDKSRLKKWMPVDMYIGGKEHSVLHLLYSRFVTMVTHEYGYAPEEEPYKQFRAHGLLIKEGAKMSKSKGNIVNPDEYIEQYGADSVRMYLMFLGDMRQGGDWQDAGMNGMHKFVNRVWTLANEALKKKMPWQKDSRQAHKTIKKVTSELESLKYNTAIAAIMEYMNYLQANKDKIGNQDISVLTQLISPFAPFIAEEIWELLGNKESIFRQPWPKYNEKLVKEEEIELVVQINGKVRDKIRVLPDIKEADAKKLVYESEKVKKWIEGKEVIKEVFVPGKLYSIVVKQ